MGQAPLVAGGISLRSDYNAAVYNEKFFENGAVPGGVLSTANKLGDTQFNRTRLQFEGRHQGKNRSHKIAVLEQGLKYERMGLTQSEMDFPELRKYSREEIMQIFGMKNAIISITEKLNFATAREQRKEWWQDTNLPYMSLIASALNTSSWIWKTPYLIRWDITTVSALQEDFNKKIKSAKDLWAMGIAFDEINERLELGFGEIEGGEIGYIPSSLIPVGYEELEPEPEVIEQIEPKKAVEAKRDTPTIEFKPEGQVRLYPEATGWEKAAEKIWKTWIKKLNKTEKAFRGKINRIFFEMRKSVLEMAYLETKGEAAPDPAVADLITRLQENDFADEKAALQKHTQPLFSEAVKTGLDSVVSELGMGASLDLSDPLVTEYLLSKNSKITGIVNTVQRQLNKSISAGYADGETIDEIAGRIRHIFDMSKTRSKTIARTEVIGASNFGRNAQMKQTNYATYQWFTAGDERVRDGGTVGGPDHVVMNGKTKAANELWMMNDGTAVRYPGDYQGAAGQVINCRCIEVVVANSLLFPAETSGDIEPEGRPRRSWEKNMIIISLSKSNKVFYGFFENKSKYIKFAFRKGKLFEEAYFQKSKYKGGYETFRGVMSKFMPHIGFLDKADKVEVEEINQKTLNEAWEIINQGE